MTIGERIRNKRIELGISQVDLAEKMNVSKQTLYKYEHNIITNIPSDKIEFAAAALGTTPSDLMGWKPEVTIVDKDRYFDVITIMDKMSDAGIVRLRQYAEDIQERYKK